MKRVDYEHFGRFLCPHTLSAHGDDLYFCLKKADVAKNCYRSDLYLLRDGSLRQLTSSGDIGEYHLLKSGIVFASLREEKDREAAERGVPLTVLQRLPYDGGEAKEFLRLPYFASSFCFLSETHFFFTAKCSRAFEEALAACGRNAEKAAARIKDEDGFLSADEIPFTANGEGFTAGCRNCLYLSDAGSVIRLSPDDMDVTLSALSPDEKKLWYTGCSFCGKSPVYEHLYEMDTATLKTDDITVSETDQYAGVWPLPGGEIAVYSETSAKYGLNEDPKLFVRRGKRYHAVRGDSSVCFGNTVCTDLLAERCTVPERIVLGKKIVLIDTHESSSRLLAVDTENGRRQSITQRDGIVSEAVCYRDGYAIIAMRGNGGCEVYSLAQDGTETCLTRLNTAICTEYFCSSPIPMSFRNEQGTPLEGWVIPPVGKRKGRKYPVILDIHSGPKTVYGPTLFQEMQLWASRGFAVIFCNPTGSDGRGDEFSDIRGGYGAQDYRDLMAFADEALRRFDFLDAKRMGVTGGSYGGFMTNWIIGHTDRFLAAASQRSISNWLSFYGTSDIGYFFAPDQTGATPWQKPEKVWAQSPLRYADKVHTPTLFLHSDADFRCPVSEGYQMFSALCAHGVPARLCVFHGENHELSRSGKPKNRIRRLREITEWFEKYLKQKQNRNTLKKSPPQTRR